LTAASKYPVLNCWIIESEGMASVHLSREMPGGQVAVANFLVDRYCLGIKDVWAEVLHRTSYEQKYVREMETEIPPRRMPPADARKLIEEAAEYARGIGFSPPADFHKALLLFGDISAADSTAEFTFGKDGKPFFIAGPNDGPARCREIISVLMNHCGPDGFDYVLPLGGDEYVGLMDDEDYEDDFDEEDTR
jgi:hypothetical protein